MFLADRGFDDSRPKHLLIFSKLRKSGQREAKPNLSKWQEPRHGDNDVCLARPPSGHGPFISGRCCLFDAK